MDDEVSASVDLRDLVARVSARTGYQPNQVDEVIRATLDELTEGLCREGKVSVRQFGIFKAEYRPGGERKTGLPRYRDQGGLVEVRPQWAIKFRPSKELKDRVNARLGDQE